MNAWPASLKVEMRTLKKNKKKQSLTLVEVFSVLNVEYETGLAHSLHTGTFDNDD